LTPLRDDTVTDWLTIDASGTTIRLPPVPEGVATALALVAAGIAFALVLALLNAWNRRAEHKPRLGRLWRSVRAALSAHYLWLILLFAVVLFLVVAGFFRIMAWPALSALSRTVLDPIAAGAEPDAEAVRAFVYGLAALTGALAILATIPFQFVRVWINERTAATGEQNLITDLINKAVAGLAAEKTVSRIGRPVAFHRISAEKDSTPEATDIEWRGPTITPPDGCTALPGAWETFEFTEPNIEVRLGAIYALERISQDSDRDHVRIMEILCAYLRENAPADGVAEYGDGIERMLPQGMPDSEKSAIVKSYEDTAYDGRLNEWLGMLCAPRPDIQAAISVIGRRRPDRILLERDQRLRDSSVAYRLDLRSVNLRRADLTELDLTSALLGSARLEGADLRKAKLDDASFQGTYLQGANLERSSLQRCFIAGHVSETNLRFCDLREADWQGTMHGDCAAHGADFRGGKNLRQEILDSFIGDANTLLPSEPSDQKTDYYVQSCWVDEPPQDLNVIIQLASGPIATSEMREKLEREFLCRGNPRRKTGTPLALDAPRPPGHPLGPGD
jgi:hypothetical protein